MGDQLPFDSINHGPDTEKPTCLCAKTQSLGRVLAAILTGAPERAFGTAEFYAIGESQHEFCRVCTPSNILSLQLYHLRQDGIAEKTSGRRFRYRQSDATSQDFVYGKRARKE
jgi:hypothetical protein